MTQQLRTARDASSMSSATFRPTFRNRLFGLVLAFAGIAHAGLAHAEGPALGAMAPDFRLQDQNGAWHTLAEYRGKWVALYFYPKDQTPGCTAQACEFRDNVFAF